MGKFKLPSTESFRENIKSSGLPEKQKRGVLQVLDYSLSHRSSLEQKQAQTRRAEAKRLEIAKKKS